MKLLWRTHPRGVVLLAVTVVVSAILPVAVAWVGKLIVDNVVALQGAATRTDAAIEHLILLVGVEFALVALIALSEKLALMLRQEISSLTIIEVNQRIMRKAVSLRLPLLEDPTYYDMLTKARAEAGFRPYFVLEAHFTILRSVLLIAGYAAVLLRFEPWAAAGMVLAGLPMLFGEARFSGMLFRMHDWRSPQARELNYISHLLGTDEHAKEIRHYGLGPGFIDRYLQKAQQFHAEDAGLGRRRMGWTFGLSLLTSLAFYGCYAAIAIAAARQRITIGDMTLYILAFRQAQIALQAGMTALGGIYENSLYTSNLFKFLDVENPPRTAQTLAAPAGNQAGLALENVGFQYRGKQDWALRHVSLVIRPGERLGIVGANGAGKSTLLKLLVGLYTPTEGNIRLDGRDLADWPPEQLRRRIGIMFQDFNRYQATLQDNVGYGDLEHIGDPARITASLRRGGGEDLISELPRGLSTRLGHWFDDGVELSGGQWQKIGLSRAVMRVDADILIFDEPTSALDAVAEHRMLDQYRQLTHGRTSILISHRFPTVRIASRIVVFHQGQIVEEGTHEELIAKKGRYAQMFSLQAAGYA